VFASFCQCQPQVLFSFVLFSLSFVCHYDNTSVLSLDTSSHFAVILCKCFFKELKRPLRSFISHLFILASYRERTERCFFFFSITFNCFLLAETENFVIKLYINVLKNKVYDIILFIPRLVFLTILCGKFRRIYFTR
jgi:hypothetical protein